MEKKTKNNIILIIKISLIIVFLPFYLIYFLYKKYKNWKFEKIKQNVLREIEKRYERFPLKDRFTNEEIIKIIIQDIENEALYKKYLEDERYKKLLYLAAIT